MFYLTTNFELKAALHEFGSAFNANHGAACISPPIKSVIGVNLCMHDMLMKCSLIEEKEILNISFEVKELKHGNTISVVI